jgi:hypothetical protein
MVGLRLTQSQATFDKLVLNALAEQIDSYFRSSIKNVIDPVRQAVRSAMRSSSTIQELGGGKLRGALGIPRGQDVTSPIIEAVANSVIIIPRPIKVKGKGFSGGFSLNVQPDNFTNLLNTSIGTVVTEKAVKLPWLSWLLTRGSSIIVADFGVRYKPGAGRSGQAQMTKGSRPFSIDPIHSGTLGNNFVTKAIMDNADEIIKAVGGAF